MKRIGETVLMHCIGLEFPGSITTKCAEMQRGGGPLQRYRTT